MENSMDGARRRSLHNSAQRKIEPAPAADPGDLLRPNIALSGNLLFLRVVASDFKQVHLAPLVADSSTKNKVPAKRAWCSWERAGLTGYDRDAMSERLWAAHTMCGRHWLTMLSHPVEIELMARGRSYVCEVCGLLANQGADRTQPAI